MRLQNNNNQGFVSIFTALIIMTVIALITLGFSYSTRQATLRTLDDQLNTQAYYAAESGVNYAQANIASLPDDFSSCTDGDVDAANAIDFSCVLIDKTPARLVGDRVTPEDSNSPTIFNINVDSGIPEIIIEWDDATDDALDPIGNYDLNSNNPRLFPSSTWGSNVGGLRIDLVPIDSLDRATMINNTYTFFLYPTTSVSGTNSTTVSSGQSSGSTALIRCNSSGSYRCLANIALTGSGANRLQYRMRAQALYNTVSMSVQAEDGSGDKQEFEEGQYVIDSTGRANDVYRRIQVAIPYYEITGETPGFSASRGAITSASSICKRLRGLPGAQGSSTIDTIGVPAGACNIN